VITVCLCHTSTRTSVSIILGSIPPRHILLDLFSTVVKMVPPSFSNPLWDTPKKEFLEGAVSGCQSSGCLLDSPGSNRIADHRDPESKIL
jgi:hypothetical protein